MTDKKLKQKAEEYADTKVEDRKGYNARWELVRNAYIAGATETTKELQEQIEKMKNRCNCKNGWYSTVGRADFGCKLGINKCEGCTEWKMC